MSSRTLVAVHRSMERDHDVLPPVRWPYAVSELRWPVEGPVEEQGQQSASVNTVTFFNLPPLRRRSSGLMAADRVSTGRDRTTNCTVDYGLCPHFGRAWSGDLWSNATPVTRSSLRPTSSLGPVHGRTNGARPTYWVLPAIDQRNTSSYFHPSTIGPLDPLTFSL